MNMKEIVETGTVGAGSIAAIASAVAVYFSKRRKQGDEIDGQADKAADRLIALLKDERAIQDARHDRLEGKVDKLTELILAYSCRRGCAKRQPITRAEIESV